MKHYKHNFLVKAPLQKVSDFHRDPYMLKKLTPPPLKVTLNKLEPVAEGSIVDFSLSFGPFAVNWISEHKNVDFPYSFKDVQRQGPFLQWEHTHSFKPFGENSTEVIDSLKAITTKSGIDRIISNFMWLNLPILFAYRAQLTKKSLER